MTTSCRTSLEKCSACRTICMLSSSLAGCAFINTPARQPGRSGALMSSALRINASASP
eukprot:CAMPEP_0181173302 /NCGR_PEP_ID=MMETSP1096-20121128/2924_1 /TAXON_ID=156174 ORGANISM="Chrysochromulina ericina, Strain CCMP281" /NCGR_SAMPLE_ID=MMETSP1096 /ASSEMBLY_ACC=CAM_ASM_000453 /LENGTH=57 /DNA_ID=CAMNT_0023261115 /DNA_START=447 /DNA_END=620 /DNA_ORIENTATION=-